MDEIPGGSQFQSLVTDLTKTGAKRITGRAASAVKRMLAVGTEPFFRKEMGERHFSSQSMGSGMALWVVSGGLSFGAQLLIFPVYAMLGGIASLAMAIAFWRLASENAKCIEQIRNEGKTYHSRSPGRLRWPDPAQERNIRIGLSVLLFLLAPAVGVAFFASICVSASLISQQQAALRERYLDMLDAQIEGEFLQSAILGECPPELSCLYKPLPTSMNQELREGIAAAAVGKPVKILGRAPKPKSTKPAATAGLPASGPGISQESCSQQSSLLSQPEISPPERLASVQRAQVLEEDQSLVRFTPTAPVPASPAKPLHDPNAQPTRASSTHEPAGQAEAGRTDSSIQPTSPLKDLCLSGLSMLMRWKRVAIGTSILVMVGLAAGGIEWLATSTAKTPPVAVVEPEPTPSKSVSTGTTESKKPVSAPAESALLVPAPVLVESKSSTNFAPSTNIAEHPSQAATHVPAETTTATKAPGETELRSPPAQPVSLAKSIELAVEEQRKTEAKRQQVYGLLATQSLQLAFFTTNGLQKAAENRERINNLDRTRRRSFTDMNERTRVLLATMAKDQASIIRDWRRTLTNATSTNDLERLQELITAGSEDMESQRKQVTGQLEEITSLIPQPTAKKGLFRTR